MLIALIIFKIILDAAYILFMPEIYAYEGFVVDFRLDNYMLSWSIYILVSFLTPHKFSKPNDYFIILATTAVIAPLASLIGIGGYTIFPLAVTVSSLLLIIVVTKLFEVLQPSLPFVKQGQSLAVISSALLVALIILWFFVTGSAFNLNFDLTQVYEYRSKNSELSSFGIFAYLNNWVYQIINVFLISYCLLKRRWVLFTLFCCIQVFFFAVSAHKSVLFYPLLIISIWYYFEKTRNMIFVPILFSGVIIVSLMFYLFLEDIIIPSMFIRRVFFIPAMLTLEYFEFFSQNANIYWSNSVLSSFIDYPYSERMTILIGQYRGTEASANNGYVSSGYAHAGILGVVIYSVILGFILSILNSMSRNSNYLWFHLALVIVPLRAVLISSDLFTSLLTHGLLISILLIFLVRERNWYKA